MNIEKRISNLPAKPEDLAEYILIGKKALKAQKAKLEAIVALEKGFAAKEAALSDTQDLAEILLYAEARLGELIPPVIIESSGRGTIEKKKSLPEGVNKKQSHYAQELSRHKEVIAEVVARAREQGEVPVRQHVLDVIKNPDWYQSSESIEWATPQWLFDLLDKEYHFETDVCASKGNAKCRTFWTKEDSGLEKEWKGSCWMNPPYGREIADWMAKAKTSADNGATVVCLVPARPDTDWWWDNAIQGEIRFIHGRLKWPQSKTMAPFPSAVVILEKNIKPKVVWWNIKKEEK